LRENGDLSFVVDANLTACMDYLVGIAERDETELQKLQKRHNKKVWNHVMSSNFW
jgi:hypothetical protein